MSPLGIHRPRVGGSVHGMAGGGGDAWTPRLHVCIVQLVGEMEMHIRTRC